MIESVTIMNLFNNSNEYLLKVYTKKAVGRLLRKEFCQEWERTIFLRKRRVEVEYKEIRIYLKKGDNIQKYIDSVPRVFYIAAANLRRTLKSRNKARRNWKLRKDICSNSYLRRQQPCVMPSADRAAMQ